MSSESEAASAFDGKNFATLAGYHEYADYFRQLRLVFERLSGYYRSFPSPENYEAKVVELFLGKLLYTIDLLRLKYTYLPGATSRSLWVDLTESGFPNFAEISALPVDFASRVDRLRDIPVSFVLKRALVDYIYRHHSDSGEILAQLSQRTYLELLDTNRMFLPFSPGPLVLQNDDLLEGRRSYVFSWGCYDFQTNRPYVHLMTFEQDGKAPPLEHGGPAFEQFLSVMQAEGSRAPDVGVLAMAIDGSLDFVHPKILKRVCLGPLYSRLLLDGRDNNPSDPYELPIRRLFAGHSGKPNDFLLFFTDEIVFSRRQEVSRTIFSPQGKVREIFAITETDPDCYARRASLVHRNALMPHRLMQHIDEREHGSIPDLERTRIVTFDERGEVHGIKPLVHTD